MTQNNLIELGFEQQGSTAPLRNLGVLDGLLLELQERPDHLPGIGVFSGPSGFGKSTAAAYVASRHQANYLEIRSTWTKKVFLENLLHQLGVAPHRTIANMASQAAEELAVSQKILILDEFDNAIDRNLVELVRDLYEQSRSPIILIGEERLPQKLYKWERFHGRILSWKQSTPANIEDSRSLASHYVSDIKFNDDLLGKIVSMARGSVRRIVVNLHHVEIYARNSGFNEISLSDWGNRTLISGNAPAPRKGF